MTRKIRRIILWFFVALFFVSSAIIVFLAQGLRFDFRSFNITRTGGIYIVTSVPDAKIYINDAYAQATGGLIKYGRLVENLLPRNYDVFVYKEGFYPWNKTIAVKAGKVVEIKNVVLFPIDLKIEKVAQADVKSLIKQFPKPATSTDGFRIRKTVLEKVGYFDEDYFLYAEDLDLCLRIKEAGYKIMYIPNVSVIHIKGISSGIKKHSRASSLAKKSARLKSINYFYSTMKIFYKKHYEKKYPIILNWLVYLGIDLKLILAKRKLSV